MEELVNLKNKLFKYFLGLINKILKSDITKSILKRWKLTLLILLSIFLVGGYFLGSVNSNKDKVIGKLEVALKEGDATELSKIIKVNGKKVDKNKLGPLIEYYKLDSSRSDSAIKILKAGGKTEAFNLETRSSLFGTTYFIGLNVYNLKVKTNFDEGKFTVNDKEYINGDDSIEGLIPGIYSIKGKLENKYGNIESSKDIVLMKDDEVNVDFQAVNIKVQSQYKDSDIYINGENTMAKVEDGKEIGPVPTDGSVLVHIEKDFPWGRIKSEEVSISKTTPIINLDMNMENDRMKSDIEEVSEKFYNSVFNALNEKKKECIEDATNGAKDKIYGVLKEKYFGLKSNYEINNINIDDSKNQFDYKYGEYKAILVVDVNYKIKNSFLGIGFGESNPSKMFLTKFTYDGSRWVVEDVENFSI